MTTSRRRLLAVLPALAVLGLSGCGPDKDSRDKGSGDKGSGDKAGASSPPPGQLDALRRALEAIPGVTKADVHYAPGDWVSGGPYWSAQISAPKLDKARLLHVLDEAYRTAWLDTPVRFAQLGFVVTNDAGIEVGPKDWPDGPETYSDMETRYGPRPHR